MQKLLLLLLFITCALPIFAQKIKYSKKFQKKLSAVQIDLYTPVEGRYKSVRSLKNDYQTIDHTISSKKEDIEIRYAIIPFDQKDQRTQIPNVDFMRVVSSTATNENEEAVISVHSLEVEDLKAHYNADWGNIAYFQPKIHFSNRKHCRLLGLYKEGRGMVYVFFLFDEASRTLDHRLQAFRFQTKI